MKRKVGVLLTILASATLLLLVFSPKAKASENKTYEFWQKHANVTWEYELDDNGNAINMRIKEYNSGISEWNSDEWMLSHGLDIPSEVNGHTVVSLGDGKNTIFGSVQEEDGGHGSKVSYVRVPNTVKKINAYAFYGKYEKCFDTIYLPDSLEEIGEYAFAYRYQNSYGLTIVSGGKENTLPSGLKKIEPYTFYYARIKPLQIPDNITEIGEYAFASATRNYTKTDDKDWMIGNNVKVIGDYAFYNTLSGEITIPDSVIKIGRHSFGQSLITSLKIGSGITEISDYAFDHSSITELVIPENIVRIGKNAFSDCDNLQSVTFSNGLKIIDNSAFEKCINLTSVVLPDSVTELGTAVFYNCKNLKTAELGYGIKNISDYTFYNCYSLETCNINEGVERIGVNAFSRCEKLKGDLIIPDSVTEIGNYAFYGCGGLDSNLVVGSGVTVFNKYSFLECNFKRITLNGLVTSIHRRAFDPALTDIWINQLQKNVNIENNGFEGRIHYKNETHRIEVEVPNGVIIRNAATDEEIASGDYACESSLEFYLEFEDGYNKEGNSLIIDSVNGETDAYNKNVKLENYNGERFTISNLLYDKKIRVTTVATRADVTLRTFIKELNSSDVATREPVVKVVDGETQYQHTKTPISVETDDLITYVIRVYNESNVATKVNEVTTYLPEGLEYVESNRKNINNKWKVSEDGRSVVSTALEDTEIAAYTNGELPEYADIEMVVRVVAETGLNEERFVTISEITSATAKDEDATYGSITSGVDSSYKYDEAVASTAESYIRGQEDDDDFENVMLAADLVVSYDLAVKDIDVDTKELLNGGEFELQDSERNVVATGVAENEGVLDFGTIRKVGSGVDTYYIVKKKSPEGYERVTKDEIKVEVTRTIINRETGEYTISIDTNIQETQTISKNYVYIPIYTREQLQKIGSDEEIEIDGKQYIFSKDENYKLMNDIDLGEDNWVPIPELNGNFNGNGFTIKNLKYISITDISEETNVGLFGKVSGEILNLNVENVEISIKNVINALSKEYNDENTTSTRKNEILKEEEKILDNINVGGIAGVVNTGKIKNCTVSGSIETEANATGGLIGKAKGYIFFYNDTNDASVMSFHSNTGGLIGIAESSISVSNCTNNGVITTMKFNAGGLVGVAATGEYQQEDVKISYLNNKIVIVVENRAVKGNYALELENKDIRTLNLLENGEFNVYNVEKHTKFENVRLVDGKLKLADIPISNLGTDTYYVEQLQAADTYVKTDKYVKFVVTRTWNGELEEYEVSVDYEVLTKEKFDEETSTDTAYRTSPSGVQYVGFEEDEDGKKYVSTSPILDVISIRNSNNNGNVRSRSTNAGGIIAKSLGDIEIHNSNNYGPIEAASYHAAGVIAEAMKENDTEGSNYIFIKNCTNEGNITGGSTAAGILTRSAIEEMDIRDSSNSASITAGQYAAGAIGEMKGNANIKNFENIADIKASEVGGAIAHSLEKESMIKIDGIHFEGNITAGAKASSVIAYALANDITVENSKIFNTTINATGSYNGGESSFIVAMANKNIIIKDISIDNAIINNGDTQYSNALIGYVCESETIDVEDINITNSTFNGAIGSLDVPLGSSTSGSVKIQNVNISNSNVNGQSVVLVYVAKKDNLVLKNINVDGIKSSNTAFGTTPVYGSILGRTQNTDLVYLDNCNVNDVQIDSFSGYDFGGLVGHLESSSDELRITNSSVANMTAKGIATNTSGLVGYTKHANNYFYNNKIENIEFNITGNIDNFGGILAYTYNNIDARKTKVQNLNVNANANQINNFSELIAMSEGSSGTNYISDTELNDNKICFYNFTVYGALMGQTGKSVRIKNTNIDNIEISPIQDYSNIGNAGGLVGNAMSDCNVQNTKINNYNMKSNNAGVLGGLIALSMSNVEIKNTSMKDSNWAIEGYCSNDMGGLVGVINSKQSLITDVDLDNIKFSINRGSGSNICYGGIVGYSREKTDLSDVNVINSEFNFGLGADDVGGIFGYVAGNSSAKNITIVNLPSVGMKSADVTGIIAGYTETIELNNVVIKNDKILDDETELYTKIIAGNSYANAGGLVGFAKNKVIANDIIVDKIDIEGHNSGGIVGKISSSGTFEGENIQVTNLNVNSNEKAAGIAGYAPNINTNNIRLENINLIPSNYGYAGGVVAVTDDHIVNISDVIISNIKINESKNSGVSSIGGICGSAYYSVNTENIEINNMDAYDATSIGGVLGVSPGNGKIIDTKISNVNISQEKTVGSYPAYGGITGNVERADINSAVLNNINIDVKEKISDAAIGSVSGRANSISNVDVNDVNVVSKGSEWIGGIAGLIKDNIDNAQIKNVDIEVSEKTNSDTIGGVSGLILGSASNINAENINIQDSSEGSVSLSDGLFGGIAGFIGGNANNINVLDVVINTKLNGAQIGGVSGNIGAGASNIIVDNLNIESKATNIGGVAGFVRDTVDSCSVSNVNVLSNVKENNIYNYGGIVGVANSVINSNVENLRIRNTGENQGLTYTGAVVGVSNYVKGLNAKDAEIIVNAIPNNRLGGIVGSINKANYEEVDTSESITDLHAENIGISTDTPNTDIGGIIGTMTRKSWKPWDNVSAKNIKISNSSESSSMDDGNYGGVAGITWNPLNNVIVENIDIDVKCQNTKIGGVAGIADNYATLSDITASNIKIAGKTLLTGGIAGMTRLLSDATVTNVEIVSSDNSNMNHSGGAAGVITATANNIAANDVVIQNSGSTGNRLGGIAGVINGESSDLNIENVNITTDINHADIGGVVGVITSTLANTSAKTVRINNSSELTSQSAGNYGGIVGVAPYSDMKITSANVDDVVIDVNGIETKIGGVAGIVSPEISDATVNNLTITGNPLVAGGISGVLVSKVDNCRVSNINITSNYEFNNYAVYGGLSGAILDEANNLTATDVSINAKAKQVKMGGISGTISGNTIGATSNNITLNGNLYGAGGIAGFINGYVENANATDITLNSDCIGSLMGGIAGNIDGYVTESDVANVNITGYSSFIGGIAGNTNSYIENSNVTNSNLLVPESNSFGGVRAGGIVGSSYAYINNCDVTDSSIIVQAPGSYVGGIVAEEGNSSAEITECNVTGSTVENLNSYTGGIVGYANCRIADSNVRNTNISTTSETDLSDAVGGIVGHGSNEKKSATVIDNCEVTDSTVKGLTKVGGLAGAVVPFIMNSTVSDTDVTGYVHVGGVIGFGGDRFVEDPNAGKDDTDDTDNTANNVVNNTAVNSTNTTNSTEDTEPTITIEDISKLPIKITNCTVSNLNVTGKLNVGEIIGLNSYNGIEFDGDDVITGTVPTGCTVTIIEDTTDSDDTQSEPSSEILEEQTNDVVIDESTATEDSNIDEPEISNSVVNNTDSSSNVDNSTNSSDTMNDIDSSNITNEVDNVVYNNVTTNEM